MNLKSFVTFQKRSPDWWIFTSLPVILIFIISLLVFGSSKDYNRVIILLVQQLLMYSIVLSSTDLGLKSKSIEISKKPIGYPLLIIFFSLSTLVYIFLMEVQVLSSIYSALTILLIAIIMSYFSVLLYNNNPESLAISASMFTKEKEDRDRKAFKVFEPEQDVKSSEGELK